MKLSALSAAALLSLVTLVGCNGSDPEQDCRDSAKSSCEKMWTCPDTLVKVGDNQEDCEGDFSALCIAGLERNDGEPCPDGQTYDSDAAEECREGVESQTCEQYNSGTVPAACSRVCAAD